MPNRRDTYPSRLTTIGVLCSMVVGTTGPIKFATVMNVSATMAALADQMTRHRNHLRVVAVSALMDHYERGAVDLRKPSRGEQVLTDWARGREVNVLMGEQQRSWRGPSDDPRASGEPNALLGGSAGCDVPVSPVGFPTITSGATELLLRPTAATAIAHAEPTGPEGVPPSCLGNHDSRFHTGHVHAQPAARAADHLAVVRKLGFDDAAHVLHDNAVRRNANVILRGPGSACVPTALCQSEQCANTTGGGRPSGIFGSISAASVRQATRPSWAVHAFVIGRIDTTSTTNTVITNGLVWPSYN